MRGPHAEKGNHRPRRVGCHGSAGDGAGRPRQLEPTQQSQQQMDDIRKMLAAKCQPGTFNLHLAQAKCRLFPNGDRGDIYREYGFEDREV